MKNRKEDDGKAFDSPCPTPWGELLIVIDVADRLRAVAFLNDDRQAGCVPSWPATRRALQEAGFRLVESAERTLRARAELKEYFAG